MVGWSQSENHLLSDSSGLSDGGFESSVILDETTASSLLAQCWLHEASLLLRSQFCPGTLACVWALTDPGCLTLADAI